MSKQHQFKSEGLSSGYDNKTILNDISIAIPNQKISVIIGANGCGKSTLLKTLSRLIKPNAGDIVLDGQSISHYPSKQFAKMVGLLPQSPIVPEGITVADLVGRGRFPHQTLFGSWSKHDYEAVAHAMDIMNIASFANRSIDELSGGQRQRVWIAMALAQQTDILFLDEPTTFLDITYQIEILDMLTELNLTLGTTIVMVLHDINLSARYADYLFALKDGELLKEGTPREVVTPAIIEEIFGLKCTVVDDPISGSPTVVPIGRYHSLKAKYEVVKAGGI